jgi:ATP-binding cassette, subfamily B, bacterial|uniref:ABC transporter ATP-binding protein n=2 Tax=Candidatus Planktophila sp. TaxID=2175601 RepID=UPI00404AC4D7
MPKSHEAELDHQYRGEHPVKTLWYLLENHRRDIFLAIVFYSIKHSPSWTTPLLIANMIDCVVYKKPLTTLAINFGLLAAITIQNYPMNVMYVRFLAKAVRNLENRLRSALVERMQQMSISFYQTTNAGALQTKVVRDVENIEQMMRHSFDGGLGAINSLIGALVITAIKVPQFLPFFLILGPISATVVIKMRKTLNTHNEDFRSEIERMSSRVNEMTTLLPITRAHGLERNALKTMYTSFSSVKSAGLRLDRLQGHFSAIAWVTFQLTYVICVGFAAWCAITEFLPITAGGVVMLSSYFGMLVGSVLLLTSIAPMLSKGLTSIRSLGELLESPDLEKNSGKRSVADVAGTIEFCDVSFTYPTNHKPSLKNISVLAEPGRMIALVGPSGSGKSTFINLVIGFLRPSTGAIKLDGQDMATIDLRTSRKFLSVVAQDTILFDGTVYENVTYGMPNPTAELAESALRAANAWEFVEKLPDGIDTIVGERGARISGGQKQRLAIARAIIRDPRILVLDEATSALDSESERLIQSALHELMKSRTTFVVAHRLSTVKEAHLILVLQDGLVVEQGTHRELVTRNGLYRRLYDAQSFIPDDEPHLKIASE